MTTYDRLSGTLLGTALGDALGLPAEGMSGRSIARRFGRIDRFRLLGSVGFVSDDTEQSALIAQSLIRHPHDPDRCARAFRRSILGWFCRLPWGVGLGTVKACLRIGLGFRDSGVMSAGNGAAMRAAIVGVFFASDPSLRERFGRALAETTHRDPRAVEGALYVAELAAACVSSPPDTPLSALQAKARAVVKEPSLASAIDRARELALQGVDTPTAAEMCGTSGFILHTAAFATFCFLKFAADPMHALTEAVAAGGDTDSIGAILGAWLGALRGETALPLPLIDRIQDGPFGPTHLRALAKALSAIPTVENVEAPRYSPAYALIRNLALYPVVIGHGLRRLLPF